MSWLLHSHIRLHSKRNSNSTGTLNLFLESVAATSEIRCQFVESVTNSCNLNHLKPEDKYSELCGNCPLAYLSLQETSLPLPTFSVDPRTDRGGKRNTTTQAHTKQWQCSQLTRTRSDNKNIRRHKQDKKNNQRCRKILHRCSCNLIVW